MRNEPDRNTGGERAAIAGIWAVLAIGAAVALAVAAAALQGCAWYKVDPDTGEGESFGFLRSMTVSETIVVTPDGTRTESRTISTQSNTGDVLLGANELLGTVVEGASKVSP